MVLERRAELRDFRQAVRDWMVQNVPDDWPRLVALDAEAHVDLQRRWMVQRHEVGLAIPHWPTEYGGADLSLMHQIVIAEESARANAPLSSYFIVALNQVPATLLTWGTEYQKRHYLPTIGAGTIWCQGFSEPGAGSDLASLQTRAIREGDAYRISGHKIWSSMSMYAEFCILLARTDFRAHKYEGITYFILHMHAPGVTVRPIRQSDGQANFAEIFLEDVRIPITDRVGDENQGWEVAQTTLSAERGVLALERAERLRYELELFFRSGVNGKASWLDDDELRRDFMRLFGEVQAVRRMVRRLILESDGGTTMPAIVKIAATTLRKRFADFVVRTADISGQLSETYASTIDNPMFDYIGSFGSVIAAGTNEILRNVIAERGLRLPREGHALATAPNRG